VRRSWRLIARDRLALVGLAIITVLVVVALWPAAWLPANPNRTNPAIRLKPPAFVTGDWRNPLGTDHLGRDLLSRTVAGTRVSVVIALLAVLLSAVLGIGLGVLAGYVGGLLDTVVMRLVDIQLAFPLLLLIIAVIAVLGSSIPILIVLLGISGWAQYARLVRAETLRVRSQEFVEASRALGNGLFAILRRHVLPNVSTTIIVVGTFEIARIFLLESAVSFLGLGVQPPTPSWGTMIADGRNYVYEGWWVATVPGVAIVLTVLAFNFLGDGLRDVLDPKTR
jgi:peptide/nickel transport system permease protein